jgi:YVTN family beta-propeller protein
MLTNLKAHSPPLHRRFGSVKASLQHIARSGAIQGTATAAALLFMGMTTFQPASGATTANVTTAAARFAGPTSSQPLALTADGNWLVVANADNDSVSFFDLRSGANTKFAEKTVQAEPNGVAFLPDGSKAYSANTVAGTVAVMRTNLAGGQVWDPTYIKVGTEPYALALTPNGSKLYVANSRSNTLSVIDTATDKVIKTITGVGFEPRGLAITNDGDQWDNDETVYVTQFLSLPIAGKIDGADDAKAGHVTLVSTADGSVVGDVTVNPIADTGFKAVGDALARIPPGDVNDPAAFQFTTGAYPNQLATVALKGKFAYLPNTGASPNGPVRFDVNTHGLVSVINGNTRLDAGKTINLHKAVAEQTNPDKLFVTQPWAMAFKYGSNQGYVASAGSNILVKVSVNATTGAITVLDDPVDGTKVHEIKVGSNPRGIVINPSDTRAYVHNHLGRSVSVVKLDAAAESVIATLQSAKLPTVGTQADKIHIGKELYNTSVGTFDPAPGTTTPLVGRMSAKGWGSCAGCHTPFGHSDNVVWIFGSGPKRTIPQHTDFDQTVADRSKQRMLNWSAERDQEEDFELNIRGVSGGAGLIVAANGVDQEPTVDNFDPSNAGRNQVKVRNVGAWDAIKAYEQFGIRSPKSPYKASDPDVKAGRSLFAAANCQSCHGGPQWTNSSVNFTPPPPLGVVDPLTKEVSDQLRQVGTFDAAFFNEVRANAAPSLGANGFVPPSLLSLHAFPQTFLHNGAAGSLAKVLKNVEHRSAGSGTDTLANAADRAKLEKFLLSIDAKTKPFPAE